MVVVVLLAGCDGAKYADDGHEQDVALCMERALGGTTRLDRGGGDVEYVNWSDGKHHVFVDLAHYSDFAPTFTGNIRYITRARQCWTH